MSSTFCATFFTKKKVCKFVKKIFGLKYFYDFSKVFLTLENYERETKQVFLNEQKGSSVFVT